MSVVRTLGRAGSAKLLPAFRHAACKAIKVMSDTQGNTPQDRRAVALSEEHERRHFIEQFLKEHPDSTAADVEGVLADAAASIAPSESRDALTAAVEEALGLLPSGRAPS